MANNMEPQQLILWFLVMTDIQNGFTQYEHQRTLPYSWQISVFSGLLMFRTLSPSPEYISAYFWIPKLCENRFSTNKVTLRAKRAMIPNICIMHDIQNTHSKKLLNFMNGKKKFTNLGTHIKLYQCKEQVHEPWYSYLVGTHIQLVLISDFINGKNTFKNLGAHV